MLREVFSFVIVIGTLMFIGAYQTGLEEATRTYRGEKSFDTIEEALVFQRDVVETATAIEAEIKESDLTKQSPPTISFVIVAPAVESSWLGSTPVQFPYGERVEEQVKGRIIAYIIFAGILTTVALLLIWTKKGIQFLTGDKDKDEGAG